MLRSKSEKILAVVQTLDQAQLESGAEEVPSLRSMNVRVYTSSQKRFGEDEAKASTMDEQCADPLVAAEIDSPVGIREVKNQGSMYEDIDLNVDKAAERDGSAMGNHYKNDPMASSTMCRPKHNTKWDSYLAKQSYQEHVSWPQVDVSPRCTRITSECGENKIKSNSYQGPPLASASGDPDDLGSCDDFAHKGASSSSESSSDIEEAASASSSGSSSSTSSSSSSSPPSPDCDFTLSDVKVDDDEEKTEVSHESGWQTPCQTLLSPVLESIRECTREDSAGKNSEEEEENVKYGVISFFAKAEAGSDVNTDMEEWVAMERVIFAKQQANDTNVDMDDWVAMERVLYSQPQASPSGMCSVQIASEPKVAGDMDYQTALANIEAVLSFWALASASLRKQLEKFLQSSMYQQAAMALFAFLIVKHPQIPNKGIQVGQRLTVFTAQAIDVLSTCIHKLRSRRALQIQSFWRRRLLAVGDLDHVCVLYKFESKDISLDDPVRRAEVEANHPPSQWWPNYIWQSCCYQQSWSCTKVQLGSHVNGDIIASL